MVDCCDVGKRHDMKLLKLVTTLQEAKNIAATLKSAGILIFIANEETRPLTTQKVNMGLVKVGVWVVLDHQYDDAIAVLSNPRHIVKHPLTKQELNAMSRELRTPFSRHAKKLLHVIAAITAGVIALCIFAYIVRTH